MSGQLEWVEVGFVVWLSWHGLSLAVGMVAVVGYGMMNYCLEFVVVG